MAKPRVPKKATEDTSLTPMGAASQAASSVSENVASAPNPGANGSTNGGASNGAAKKTAAKKSIPTPKPEIVKSEARASVVPINLEEEIRRLAYLLSERRGFEPGHEAEDWLAAEREIRQRYHQHSA